MNEKTRNQIAIGAVILVILALVLYYTNPSGFFSIVTGGGLSAAAPTASNLTLTTGQGTTLTPHATGGTKPYTFTWYFNTAQSPSCTTANVLMVNGVSETANNPVLHPTKNGYYTYAVSDSETPPVWNCAGLGILITVGATPTTTLPTTSVKSKTITTTIATTTSTLATTSTSTSTTTSSSTTTVSCFAVSGCSTTTSTSTSTTPTTTMNQTTTNPGNPNQPNLLQELTTFFQQLLSGNICFGNFCI